MSFSLYPSLTFLIVAANLFSLYMKGFVLISWWWILGAFALEFVLALSVAAAADNLKSK